MQLHVNVKVSKSETHVAPFRHSLLSQGSGITNGNCSETLSNTVLLGPPNLISQLV